MSYDILIKNAKTRKCAELVSIAIEGGKIAAIEKDLHADAKQVIDAKGGLVTESFINGHLHLDKVYTLQMAGEAALKAYNGDGMGGAMTSIERAADFKAAYDESWIIPNVRKACDLAVKYGNTHIRAFADVDTKARLEGVKALLKAREEYKGRVELQNMGAKTNVLIADYQVITDRDTTEHIQDNVYNMVMDYLACGIDPDKTMIYAHSAVPAANQLMLPFLSLVSEAELARNPTVKAEMEASGHELTGLLLTYPVHQACDILFCKGNVVPVGRDQLPHIELTRTIARRFNNRYGKVFPEVDALLSETPLLPGLDGRKMSKSYGNAINISMTAEETAKRIKKSQTDSERMITFDPENRPGVSGLLSTAAICTGRSEVEIAEEIGMGGSGQLKKYVTEAVNEYFAPIRERRQRYENDLNYVKDVLHEGNRRANEIADQTLAEVQDAMGMVY